MLINIGEVTRTLHQKILVLEYFLKFQGMLSISEKRKNFVDYIFQDPFFKIQDPIEITLILNNTSILISKVIIDIFVKNS